MSIPRNYSTEGRVNHTKVYRPDPGAGANVQNIVELATFRRYEGQLVVERHEEKLVLEIEPLLFRLGKSLSSRHFFVLLWCHQRRRLTSSFGKK